MQAQTTSVENREFKMHPDLLWSVIQSQSGAPEKAILEAIMNAVDAGATYCDITIGGKGYSIKDDGKGFQSRTEIEDFFEVFGKPHAEGDATYGKYRMGRGQLFSFSKTHWRSGTFSMNVDIKKQGLNYDLVTDLSLEQGCSIDGEWYEWCDAAEVIRITHDLTNLAHWMQITVKVNGKRINKIASEQTWTLETDDAYISTKITGGLAIYNLGALVNTYPAYKFGISGTIVSKKQLQVNFARTEILLAQCEVWKRIRRELDKLCGNLTKKKSVTLHSHERDAIANRFVRGELPFSEVANIGLVFDVSGKQRTLKELSNTERLTLAPDRKDWTIGERVMNQKLAFVINSATLDRFNVTSPEEFLDLLKLRTNLEPSLAELVRQHQAEQESHLNQMSQLLDNNRSNSLNTEYARVHREYLRSMSDVKNIMKNFPYNGIFNKISVACFNDLSKNINDTYELVLDKTLSPHQLAIKKGLEAASTALVKKINAIRFNRLPDSEKKSIRQLYFSNSAREISYDYEIKPRKTIIGKSDVAQAWTDGESYVAFDIKVINAVIKNQRSLSSLASILVHEFCHEEADIGGHVHSPDFYELFHDYCCDDTGIEALRYWILRGYAKAIEELGKQPTPILLKELKTDSKAMGESYDRFEKLEEIS